MPEFEEAALPFACATEADVETVVGVQHCVKQSTDADEDFRFFCGN
jgi:hypothetical protein